MDQRAHCSIQLKIVRANIIPKSLLTRRRSPKWSRHAWRAVAYIVERKFKARMAQSPASVLAPPSHRLEEITLDELIDDCLCELSPLFETRNVGCAGAGSDSARPNTPVEIRADPRLLRQALLNVIRNAVEAIPEGRSERLVTID